MSFFRRILVALFISSFSISSVFASSRVPFALTTQMDHPVNLRVAAQIDRCQSLIEKAYFSLPFGHRTGLENLQLSWSSKASRGMGGGDTIHIRCNNMTDSELVAVFIHEMGHILDTGVIQGNAASGASAFRDNRIQLFNDDRSIGFYLINWVNTQQQIRGSSPLDFVSGYAQTDPFEDFAESYVFYVLHGADFSEMAQYNDRLKKKYTFLRDQIFDGQEFLNNYRKPNLKSRFFDTTLLTY